MRYTQATKLVQEKAKSFEYIQQTSLHRNIEQTSKHETQALLSCFRIVDYKYAAKWPLHFHLFGPDGGSPDNKHMRINCVEKPSRSIFIF